MKRPRFDWYSDPLINHLIYGSRGVVERIEHPERKRIFDELMFIHSAYHQAGFPSTKEYFKARLGRQSYCETFYERKWVWESEIGWRAYVGSEGLSFEVRTDLDDDEVIAAWDHFKRTLLGLTQQK